MGASLLLFMKKFPRKTILEVFANSKLDSFVIVWWVHAWAVVEQKKIYLDFLRTEVQ